MSTYYHLFNETKQDFELMNYDEPELQNFVEGVITAQESGDAFIITKSKDVIEN